MKILLFILILTGFLSDFNLLTTELGGIGKVFSFLPEALSGLITLVILIDVSIRRPLFMLAPKYYLLGLFFLLTIFAGFILNSVQTGPFILGLREYLRFLPLFLIPVIYRISDDDFKDILLLVLAFTLIQPLVGIYQFLTEYQEMKTGDVVKGTFSNAGILTMYLCSAIACFYAFYLKKIMKLWQTLLASGALMVPILLSDSRAGVILILAAILTVGFFASSNPLQKMKVIGLTSLIALFSLGVFIAAYDSLFKDRYSHRYEGGLLEFYLEGGAQKDFYKQRAAGVGKGVGRLDSIGYALDKLEYDLPTLMFGFGAGNVVKAPFKAFDGAYANRFAIYGVNKTTVTNLLWETGLLGVAACIVFLIFLWRDTRDLATRSTGMMSIFALAWMGVLSVLAFSLVYKNIIHQNAMMILVLVFSGQIAARHQEMKGREKKSIYRNFNSAHLSHN